MPIQLQRTTHPRIAITALALVVALAGCGGGKDAPGVKSAIARASQQDTVTIETLLREYTSAASDYGDYLEALPAGKFKTARTRIETANAELSEAQSRVIDLNSSARRDAVQSYADAMLVLAQTGDRLLSFIEAGETPFDERLFSRLYDRLDGTLHQTRGVDRKLARRLLEHAGPAERARVDERLRELQKAQRRVRPS